MTWPSQLQDFFLKLKWYYLEKKWLVWVDQVIEWTNQTLGHCDNNFKMIGLITCFIFILLFSIYIFIISQIMILSIITQISNRIYSKMIEQIKKNINSMAKLKKKKTATRAANLKID